MDGEKKREIIIVKSRRLSWVGRENEKQACRTEWREMGCECPRPRPVDRRSESSLVPQ